MEESGMVVDTSIFIAATAVVNKIPVLTKNGKQFQRI